MFSISPFISLLSHLLFLPFQSPGLLCSGTIVDESKDEVLEGTFIWEPADQRIWQATNLKITFLVRPPRFFVGSEQRWGKVRKHSKKAIQSLQMSPRMANLEQDFLHSSQVGSSGLPPEAGHQVPIVTKQWQGEG